MAVEHTGGMSVQTDTFHNPVFKDSFKRVFAKQGEDGHMGIASNATIEVPSPTSPNSISPVVYCMIRKTLKSVVQVGLICPVGSKPAHAPPPRACHLQLCISKGGVLLTCSVAVLTQPTVYSTPITPTSPFYRTVEASRPCALQTVSKHWP